MSSARVASVRAVVVALLLLGPTLGAIATAVLAAPPVHSGPPAPSSFPTPPSSVTPPSPAGFTPRGPIRILSDAGFNASNGVVAGNGTAAAPFLITGWSIVATGVPAIEVRNVRAAFAIEGNRLEMDGAASVTAVIIENASTRGLLANNSVLSDGVGVTVRTADVLIEGNFLWDTSATIRTGRGLILSASSSRVLSNRFVEFDTAAAITGGMPLLCNNTVQGGSTGLVLAGTQGAVLEENQFFLVAGTALHVENAVGTLAFRNAFVNLGAAIRQVGGSLTAEASGFWDVSGRAIHADSEANLEARSNNVTGGGTGFEANRAVVTLSANRLENLIGTAVLLGDVTGTVSGNTLVRNGGGISLGAGSLVAATDNLLTDNVWGFSIPYSARQNIPLLAGNVVNGVNIDGTLVPSERVYFWRTAAVTIAAQTRDSGHASGRYGSLAKEGLVVLYDVEGALVTGSRLSDSERGVYAVNSFNVSVSESLLLNLRCGVVFEGTTGAVKDSNVTIVIDPPGSCGVDVRGGYVLVLRNEMSVLDTAIRFDATAEGRIEGNLLVENHVGIDLRGSLNQMHDVVLVANNTVLDGRVGIQLTTFRGRLEGNVVAGNTRVGIALQSSAEVTLEGNVVVGNLEGITDRYECTLYGVSCSRVVLEANVVAHNEGDGIRVRGGATLVSNVVTGNGGNGAVLTGDVSLVAENEFSLNGLSGAVIATTTVNARFRGNVYDGNGEDGLVLSGTVSMQGDVAINQQYGAGIRFRGLLLDALRLNVSANLDGIIVAEPLPATPAPPTVNVPSLLGVLPSEEKDPLYLHLSIIAGNLRYAIQSTPQTEVNATYNYWGTPTGPRVNIANQVGAFNNAVSPTVRFLPFYTDRQMTIVGPVQYL